MTSGADRYMSGWNAEQQQAKQQVWPESYELGRRVAASVCIFSNGLFEGFAQTYSDQSHALIDALAVEYGKLLLDIWLDDYRAAWQGERDLGDLDRARDAFEEEARR